MKRTTALVIALLMLLATASPAHAWIDILVEIGIAIVGGAIIEIVESAVNQPRPMDCRPRDPVTYEILHASCPQVNPEAQRLLEERTVAAQPVLTPPPPPRDCRYVPFAELRACMGATP